MSDARLGDGGMVWGCLGLCILFSILMARFDMFSGVLNSTQLNSLTIQTTIAKFGG